MIPNPLTGLRLQHSCSESQQQIPAPATRGPVGLRVWRLIPAPLRPVSQTGTGGVISLRQDVVFVWLEVRLARRRAESCCRGDNGEEVWGGAPISGSFKMTVLNPLPPPPHAPSSLLPPLRSSILSRFVGYNNNKQCDIYVKMGVFTQNRY